MTVAADAFSDGWVDANQEFLSAAIAVVAGHLTGHDVTERVRQRDNLRAQMSAAPAIEGLRHAFALSDFEVDTLLLAAGVELDSAVMDGCASAHGDPNQCYATFSLALAKLPEPHWSAITPTAPLRRWHLVELAHPHTPTTSMLRVDERVLHALTGLSYLDPRIECLAEGLPPPFPLPRSLRSAAEGLIAQWSGEPPRRVRLHGSRRPDLRAVVASAANGLGLQAAVLRSADLPTTAVERELLARLCELETALAAYCWLFEIDDPVTEPGRSALQLARRIGGPIAIACPVPPVEDGDEPALEVPAMALHELRELWRSTLSAEPLRLAGLADRLASQFQLGAADVRSISDQVQTASPEAGQQLWESCRSFVRPALDGLAQRVPSSAVWQDLVLPESQGQLLRELTLHVRHRMTVFEDWGFGARIKRGTGVAALFVGPSGTGKTHASEVIANDLHLDLYRVDLSQVVSKYIGETEKNLKQIFDAAETGGVVLLFDEADALFGKRSEVKDSHDRYANIEVSYLLQRMEEYRSLAILTTNLKEAIDTAFLRRLRFVVQFPFPDAAGRADIWRRVLPPELPTEGLVLDRLARLAVSGGTIRNIALAAAFHAAEAGEPMSMMHVLRAARTEYAKLEKPLTDGEVAEWMR